MRKIIILLILINFGGCKGTDCNNSVALFFNPVSLKPTTYHLTALAGKLILIDTSLKSSQIDKSILMKCFDAAKVSDITIVVNGTKRGVKLDSLLKIKGPTSVFIKYDDRIKLDLLFKSYTAKSIKSTGEIPEYKKFVDSATIHGSMLSKFDSLSVFIKKDKCWCKTN